VNKMDRTYNVFVDNGLYVLGYYLEKDIKDITIDDIKNSTEIFIKKFIEYENCNYYNKNIDMGFHNSSYTQKTKKLKNNDINFEFIKNNNSKYHTNKDNDFVLEDKYSIVKYQFKTILNNIGEDEYCTVCGQKHIRTDLDKDYISAATRSLMPRLHSNTFINYINNLQRINICPICLYLSMISLFNFTKANSFIVLYNSDNDEFMEDITYDKQIEVTQNLAIQAKENKEKIDNISYTENIIESIINKGKLYDGYIQTVSFYNGGKDEDYSEGIISNKDLKFIKNLMGKSLLSEFKKEGLFEDLINEQIQENYISCVFDFNKEKLRVSKELFIEIEEVYSKLGGKLELIKDICNKIYNNNDKDEIQQLKNINNLTQFQELLLNWNEMYKNKKNINLFNKIEEFQGLCDYKDFKTVKNTMLMQFMLLNN